MAEGARLESVFRGNSNVGSNPTLSASNPSKDILPTCLGARPIALIEAPDLMAMTKAIEQRGARDIAKRALETTGQVFRFAIAHGYATRNPASEIRPSDILKSTRKVNYARVDARELPDLLRAMEVYQGTHVTRLALKLMALTFVRTSELIGAKWVEFDAETARWDIPAERMKMRTSLARRQSAHATAATAIRWHN